jgi:hypothetical protein
MFVAFGSRVKIPVELARSRVAVVSAVTLLWPALKKIVWVPSLTSLNWKPWPVGRAVFALADEAARLVVVLEGPKGGEAGIFRRSFGIS